jgi:hypothetical protein
MARVRSTTRVAREGEEAGASGTTPISEMMKHSGLVVQEEKESVPTGVAIAEAGPITAEAEPTTTEADSDNEDVSHPDFRVQNPGANIITRCAGTKSHTYDESWHRIECHIFTT